MGNYIPYKSMPFSQLISVSKRGPYIYDLCMHLNKQDARAGVAHTTYAVQLILRLNTFETNALFWYFPCTTLVIFSTNFKGTIVEMCTSLEFSWYFHTLGLSITVLYLPHTDHNLVFNLWILLYSSVTSGSLKRRLAWQPANVPSVTIVTWQILIARASSGFVRTFVDVAWHARCDLTVTWLVAVCTIFDLHAQHMLYPC